MAEPTLAEIAQQIEVLETAEAFGEQLQQFTDFLQTVSGGNATDWLSDDPTVQYELAQLKDAAFEFSEALNGMTEFAAPLAQAAETAGNINTAAQAVLSFSTAVAKADESTGAEKASQLADVISGVTDLAQLLTGLSVNPVIGVFIGLYAVALQNAAIGLEKMEAYAARRNEIINSRGGEIDIAAELTRQEAAAERAEEARREMARQLSDLYAKRGALIAGLQAGQYRVALDFCASRNRDALRKLIATASQHGGIVGNATPNGESLEQVENIVSELAGAAFDAMLQAQAAPDGSEAEAELIERAENLLDTKRELIDGLGPLRDCVKEALERYGYSTADAGSAIGGGIPRGLVIGGGGIFAAAMVGLFIVIGGGGDGEPATATPTTAVGGGTTIATSSATIESTPTAAGTPTPAPTPPEGYGPCHIHPDEDALFCRAHYDIGNSSTTMHVTPEPPYMWESTQTFVAPIPTNPELPIEYRLVIESTNGQQIEHLLSGGPGEPLTCVKRVNGVEAPVAPGEVCGNITAPDTIYLLIDVSILAPGEVTWVFSTLETEADGTRRGDWSAGGGGNNFQLHD